MSPEAEEPGPWLHTLFTCDHCAHRWVPVYPMACMTLTCPACALTNAAPVLRCPLDAVAMDLIILPIRDKTLALHRALTALR